MQQPSFNGCSPVGTLLGNRWPPLVEKSCPNIILVWSNSVSIVVGLPQKQLLTRLNIIAWLLTLALSSVLWVTGSFRCLLRICKASLLCPVSRAKFVRTSSTRVVFLWAVSPTAIRTPFFTGGIAWRVVCLRGRYYRIYIGLRRKVVYFRGSS